LQDGIHLVEDALRNVRELSHLLHPTILDDFGLDAGLRWLSERFSQRTGIPVEYESNFAGRLPDETETHLFRIGQEALTNVARHSGATRVSMSLEAGADSVALSIQDNGHGLPAGLETGHNGLGLIGMRARARSAGGEMRIFPVNGTGLRIEVRVPHGQRKNHEEKDQHPAGG
jgi:signal transduction histidine kinase